MTNDLSVDSFCRAIILRIDWALPAAPQANVFYKLSTNWLKDRRKFTCLEKITNTEMYSAMYLFYLNTACTRLHDMIYFLHCTNCLPVHTRVIVPLGASQVALALSQHSVTAGSVSYCCLIS